MAEIGQKIREILNTAKEHVQYPKLRLKIPDQNVFGEQRITENAKDLQLSFAGPNSRYRGSVMLTNGKPFSASDNFWYGHIMPNGQFNFAKKTTAAQANAVLETCELFTTDPAKYASLYGKQTGNCMFCGKQLTDPQSIAVGYGPICAEHYGLPHGEIDKAVADQFAQIEIDMPVNDAYDTPEDSNADESIWVNAKEEKPSMILHRLFKMRNELNEIIEELQNEHKS